MKRKIFKDEVLAIVIAICLISTIVFGVLINNNGNLVITGIVGLITMVSYLAIGVHSEY